MRWDGLDIWTFKTAVPDDAKDVHIPVPKGWCTQPAPTTRFRQKNTVGITVIVGADHLNADGRLLGESDVLFG